MRRQKFSGAEKELAHLDHILCPIINFLVTSRLNQVDRSKTSLTQRLPYCPLPTPKICLCWNQD